MTVRKILKVSLLATLMSIFLSACTMPARPPKEGVFIARQGAYVQLIKYSGWPNEVSTVEIATENPIEITVDISGVKAENIKVITANKEVLEFNVIYTSNEFDWFRLRLKKDLEKGIYCVTSNGQDVDETSITYWCFQVP